MYLRRENTQTHLCARVTSFLFDKFSLSYEDFLFLFSAPHFTMATFLLILALLLPPPPVPPPPCHRWLGMVKASTLIPTVFEGMALNCFLSELYL